MQILRAVLQLAHAFVKLIHAVHQLCDGIVQIVRQAARVQIQIVVISEAVENGIRGNRIASGGRIIRHIRSNGGNRRDVDVNIVVLVQMERFIDTGQTIAQYSFHVAGVDDLSVGDFDIIIDIVIHQHHGGHQERNSHAFRLAAHIHALCLRRGILNRDLQMAALPRQFVGRNGFAVQLVAHMDADRQRRVGCSLIADVRTIGLPDDHAVFIGPGLASAHILDIVKGA